MVASAWSIGDYVQLQSVAGADASCMVQPTASLSLGSTQYDKSDDGQGPSTLPSKRKRDSCVFRKHLSKTFPWATMLAVADCLPQVVNPEKKLFYKRSLWTIVPFGCLILLRHRMLLIHIGILLQKSNISGQECRFPTLTKLAKAIILIHHAMQIPHVCLVMLAGTKLSIKTFFL